MIPQTFRLILKTPINPRKIPLCFSTFQRHENVRKQLSLAFKCHFSLRLTCEFPDDPLLVAFCSVNREEIHQIFRVESNSPSVFLSVHLRACRLLQLLKRTRDYFYGIPCLKRFGRRVGFNVFNFQDSKS